MPRYKVGDLVEVQSNTGGGKDKLGDVVSIVHVIERLNLRDLYISQSNYSPGESRWDGGYGYPYFESELRPVAEDKMKIEELSKENIKEAKKQFETEKNNAEIEFAKKELRRLTDEEDRLEREYTKLDEQYEKIQAELELFRGK